MLPNLTLIIQIVAFMAVAWLVMRYGWPPILAAIEERQKQIAHGLAASERGEKELVAAKSAANDILKEARGQATKIVDQANRRSNELVEEARGTAVVEGQRLIADARQEVALESTRAREQLRREAASLAVVAALPSCWAVRSMPGRMRICSTSWRTRSNEAEVELMAENITIARPYARAAFAYANERKALARWSALLAAAAALVQNPKVAGLLTSPKVTAQELAVAGQRRERRGRGPEQQKLHCDPGGESSPAGAAGNRRHV